MGLVGDYANSYSSAYEYALCEDRKRAADRENRPSPKALESDNGRQRTIVRHVECLCESCNLARSRKGE